MSPISHILASIGDTLRDGALTLVERIQDKLDPLVIPGAGVHAVDVPVLDPSPPFSGYGFPLDCDQDVLDLLARYEDIAEEQGWELSIVDRDDWSLDALEQELLGVCEPACEDEPGLLLSYMTDDIARMLVVRVGGGDRRPARANIEIFDKDGPEDGEDGDLDGEDLGPDEEHDFEVEDEPAALDEVGEGGASGWFVRPGIAAVWDPVSVTFFKPPGDPAANCHMTHWTILNLDWETAEQIITGEAEAPFPELDPDPVVQAHLVGELDCLVKLCEVQMECDDPAFHQQVLWVHLRSMQDLRNKLVEAVAQGAAPGAAQLLYGAFLCNLGEQRVEAESLLAEEAAGH